MLLYADRAPIRIHQAQFRLERRFADRFGFLLGYTLGSANSIADGGTPSNKYDLMSDWGPTSNDVRHRFVANAVYELPFGIQAGGIVTAGRARKRADQRNRKRVTAGGVCWNRRGRGRRNPGHQHHWHTQ